MQIRGVIASNGLQKFEKISAIGSYFSNNFLPYTLFLNFSNLIQWQRFFQLVLNFLDAIAPSHFQSHANKFLISESRVVWFEV